MQAHTPTKPSVRFAGHALVAAMLGLTVALPAAADTIQPVDSIRDAALEHARADLGPNAHVEAGRLDQRLRLHRCDAPLETFDPPGHGNRSRTTVGVRCETPRPWTLYVPITVQSFKEILAATRSLPRGHVLEADDLEPVTVDTNRTRRGYFTDMERLVGQELTRSMRSGEPVTHARVRAPQLIKRGERVTLQGGNDVFQIRMSGEALSDGALGDRIRVRNRSSDRIVEGRILEDGSVRVGR